MEADRPSRFIEAQRHVQTNIITIWPLCYTSRQDNERNLIAVFYHQLTKGCGSRNCEKTSCYTYRLRTAQRPLRRYTPLTARTLAVYLASEEEHEKLLCDAGAVNQASLSKSVHQSPDDQALNPINAEYNNERSKPTRRKDCNSFTQQFFDSGTIREYAHPNQSDIHSLHESMKCKVLKTISANLTINLHLLTSLAHLENGVAFLSSTHPSRAKFLENSSRHVFGDPDNLAACFLEDFKACETDELVDIILTRCASDSINEESAVWRHLRLLMVQSNLQEIDWRRMEIPRSQPFPDGRHFDCQDTPLPHLHPLRVDRAMRWWIIENEEAVLRDLHSSLCMSPEPTNHEERLSMACRIVICMHALAACVPTSHTTAPAGCSDHTPQSADSVSRAFASEASSQLAKLVCTVLVRLYDASSVADRNDGKTVLHLVTTHLKIVDAYCLRVKALTPLWPAVEQPLLPGDKDTSPSNKHPHCEECLRFTLHLKEGHASFSENIGCLKEIACRHDRMFSFSFNEVLCMWFTAIVFREWDEQVILKKESSTFYALTCLEWFHANIAKLGDGNQLAHFHTTKLYQIGARADPYKLALGLLNTPPDCVSLTYFGTVFDSAARIRFFRAICFDRMLKANEEAHSFGRLIKNGVLSWPAHPEDFAPPPQIPSLIETLQTNCSRSLAFEVRRSHLIEDTLDQLWKRSKDELLRPLKIKILNQGEEGQDQGGVAQEFFRLVFAEIFDPKKGLFTVDERTRMAWFNPGSLEPLYKYELIGALMALAVHNGFTLPITLPLILYSRLADGGKARYFYDPIADLQDGWPDLATGFRQLLEWSDGDVSDIFARSFVFSFRHLDGVAHIDMTKTAPNDEWSAKAAVINGKEIEEQAPLVTNQNRLDFVDKYMMWLCSISVRPQWNSFSHGFYSCIPQRLVASISGRQLQTLVEGDGEVDIDSLQAATRYEGWSADTSIIGWFWDIVRAFSTQQQKKLLEFVTASDRIPAVGVKHMDFVIQRNGGDSESLPTSMTCFGRLLLPEYSSTFKLKEKLNLSLENSTGFGVR